jgi:hypothetical protein
MLEKFMKLKVLKKKRNFFFCFSCYMWLWIICYHSLLSGIKRYQFAHKSLWSILVDQQKQLPSNTAHFRNSSLISIFPAPPSWLTSPWKLMSAIGPCSQFFIQGVVIFPGVHYLLQMTIFYQVSLKSESVTVLFSLLTDLLNLVL